MPIHIQAPDGAIAEFPDGTPDATIKAVMAKTYGGPQSAPKPNVAKDVGKQFLSGIGEGVAGISDMVAQASPVGMVMGGLRNAARLADLTSGHGGPNVTAAPMAVQQTAVRQATPVAQTAAGRYARSVGQMVPNAVAPGSAARRVANVVLPGVGAQAGADAAQAMGGNPFAVAAGRMAGAMGGAGLASGSIPNPFASNDQSPEEVAANLFAGRGRLDPEQMKQRAQAMTEAGVQPSALDVVGDTGRRFIRAVGVKDEQAGETLADNANAVSATAKPAIMARTRDIGPFKGVTADDLVAQLFKQRDEAATTNYAPAYETKVPLDENIISALQDAPGRAALQRALRAAVARQDDARVGEIQSILKAGTPMPTPAVAASRLSGLKSVQNTTTLNEAAPVSETYPTPDSVSAATLDRTQIAFRNQAERLRRNQGGDIASGLTQRQNTINTTLDQVPELQPARAEYRATSQAIDTLGKGRADIFSTDPADYAKWLDGLSPQAREANKVAIRQEILDTLGGQRSSTFGSVDELGTSEYARANLRQALGGEADPYIAHINARVQQVRNARMVDPNGGSRTAVLENDLKGVMQAAGVGKSAIRGDVLGVVGKLGQWFLSRGVSPQQARALATASTDPNRLPQILSLVEQYAGRPAVEEFLQLRNAGLIGGASAVASAQAARAAPQATDPR